MCSIFLIKPQRQKTVVLAAKYQLKRVTIAAHHSLFILNDLTHLSYLMLPYEQKR